MDVRLLYKPPPNSWGALGTSHGTRGYLVLEDLLSLVGRLRALS